MKKSFDFKSLLIGVITGSMLFGGIVGASTLITDNVYLNKYAVTVDGKAYNPTLPLLNYGGSTYVPLKEFGTITGASVTFANDTIVVKKPTGTSTGTTTPSTGTTTTKPSTSALNGKKMTIDAGDSDSFYVDLNAYASKSATVSITSGTAYISISKTSISTSSLVNVTAKKAGSAMIKVAYNNGYTDYITVTVNALDEIKLGVGSTHSIEIDLDEHDADKATLSISSGKDYITLAKTSMSSSGKVKVTGKKAGEATVKVAYDSGDTIYYDFTVSKSSSSASDEIEVEIAKGSKFIYYIDLDEYDADEADIYLDDDDECLGVTLGTSTKVTSSKTTTSSKTITIEGKDTGMAEVEIEFDSGDIFTIYVDVVSKTKFDFDYYYDNSEYDFEIDKGDWEELEIDLDDYDADWATISVIAGYNYITAYDTFVDNDSTVDIDGDDDGEAIIQVTYSTGDVEYYYIEVVD